MSLSGLDSPAVNEAYQSTLNEPGGWFLLKYLTRDEVEVLSQGHGGFGEAAAAVASYTDKSPLYGFLLYRRRKVILKYIPEGTSRLLLARTSVHFQSVQDRFAPHDAIFNATTAGEITEAALSASCSLHTANSVYSTSSSLRKQNLGGISEDAEDNNNRTDSPGADDLHADHQAATAFQDSFERPSSVLDRESVTSTANGNDPSRYHAPRKLETITSREDVSTPEPQNRPSSGVPSEPMSVDDDDFSHAYEDRPDTAYSSKHTWDDYYQNMPAAEPKTKQGPRPVTGRSSRATPLGTGGGARQKMPAGVKVSYRKHEDEQKREARKEARSRSGSTVAAPRPSTGRPPSVGNETGRRTAEGSHEANGGWQRSKDIASPEPIAIPAIPSVPTEFEPLSPRTIETSSTTPMQQETPVSTQQGPPKVGPIKSKPTEAKTPVMSPEKLRLMRALDLRKRQLAGGGRSGANSTDSPSNNKADSAVGIVESGVSSDKLSVQPPSGPGERGFASQAGETQAHSPASLSSPGAASLHRTPSEALSATSPTSQMTGELASSLADDEVIQELQNVTVQRAQTVQVNAPEDEVVNNVTIKTGASPGRNEANKGAHQSPDSRRSRGLSSLSKPSTDQMSISKRANVSSGISRRIQALAEHSSRDGSPHSPHRDDFPNEPSVPFSAARNFSLTNASRTNSMVRVPRLESRAESRAESRGTSPTRSIFRAFRSGSKTSHGPSSTTVYSDFTASNKSEQRTITARIVRRNDVDTIDSRLEQTDSTPNQFAPTPTIVSANGSGAAHRPYTAATTRPGSRDSLLSNVTAKSSWRTFGRRNKDVQPQPQQQQYQSQPAMPSYPSAPAPQLVGRESLSNSSLDRVDENYEETKSNSSKTSRLLKRISGFSAGRRSDKDSSRNEKSSRKAKPVTLPVRNINAPPGFNVGDLNVQFPDSLLWKRRWVQIDSAGFLVLTTARENERPQTAFLKKYRLSEFRMPAIPSQERQELPYSLILDFVAGGTLQLACGDSLSQASILKRLVDAWDSWAAIDR